uniref:Complexin-1 n=1 Tax=Romanomermis culicivorax TaxID=13658 RepID=A0A915K955_ROMCU
MIVKMTKENQQEGRESRGLDKLAEGDGMGASTAQVEDPEIAEARQEAEQRRQEKHRRIEAEREKVREGIRNKYGIKKKEDRMEEEIEGRIGAVKRKTPEELVKECEIDDSLMGQLSSAFGKAKTAVTESPIESQGSPTPADCRRQKA